MRRQQVFVVVLGVALLASLYFFGRTVSPKGAKPVASPGPSASEKPLDINEILQSFQQKLNAQQADRINRLNQSVVRGDVKAQQLSAYRSLAGYWKDSVSDGFLPAMYYLGQVAKLENSEKSLTFAAQLFLTNLRGQQARLRTWMADQSKELFQKALDLDPGNDSARVGLGACYIFGGSASDPQQVMQGIQQILQVARKDSNNMYAQFMLGLGAMESGQVDRAVIRLSKVTEKEPSNIEALLTLASAYEQTGKKPEAIARYRQARSLITDQETLREIDQRIKTLQ